MAAEDAEDDVRVGCVESTPWVLGHQCSGLEKAEEKWGGTVRVSVGARDLSGVWVYGVVAQGAEGLLPLRVVALRESA